MPIVAHQTDRVARLSLTACPAVEWVWFLTFPAATSGQVIDERQTLQPPSSVHPQKLIQYFHAGRLRFHPSEKMCGRNCCKQRQQGDVVE